MTGKKVNPELIVLARESRTITQKELARKLKIAQYQVSRMENGQLPDLTSEKLIEISKILSYPVDFFLQECEVYPVGQHLYRKHATLPAKERDRIVAQLNIYRLSLRKVMKAIDIEGILIKECELDEYATPEDVARAIREYLRLPRGPIQNMTKILEDFGIVVVPYDSLTRMFSGASIYAESPSIIAIANKNMPGDRWRFTLAHELGHIIMHRLPRDTMEDEADRFAAEFLMPAQQIGVHLDGLNFQRLAELKLYWKVSMSALLKRASDLNRISERKYRSMWVEFGKQGYRVSEPKELDVPLEKPSLIYEILNVHFQELGYNRETLSNFLSIFPEDFDRLFNIKPPSLRLVS